ncbi:AbiTii domain-containing protein [Pseudarthrobacter albicanus]|uniref:AbiTii domain-containing protein n=1 Tax=Pseudarthrobacter albicanus TaxID=2823873 RepID=UPI001BAA167B|nr:hypothetical protein [Pseudarthrobacter albicanus]
MTLLDELIIGATDDTVSTSNLLRKMLVLGYSLEAAALQTWAQKELNGYGTTPVEEYPAYRGPIKVPVEVTFSGPVGSWYKHYVSPEAVPDEQGFRAANFYSFFNQPVAELEKLSQAETNLHQAWPISAANQLENWGKEGRAPRMEYCGVYSASKIISPQLIHGITETIRNKALMFSLELRQTLPGAGQPAGPTVKDPNIRSIVTWNINQNIYGGTNTVGVGETLTQNVNISQGDTGALLEALKGLGLNGEDQAALRVDLEAVDGTSKDQKAKNFLNKLQDGLIKLSGAAATPILVSTAKTAFTAWSGIPIA